MRKAVVSVAIGDRYRALANLTHPLMKKYAEKIGAEFLCLDQKVVSRVFPHFEKLQIFNLLNKYDRILYLDADVLVRNDCPDLFEMVPPDKFGAFNEGGYVDHTADLAQAALQYALKQPETRDYYNAGVMVVSRMHKFLFNFPPTEIQNHYEQGMINIRLLSKGIPVHPLPYQFNRMSFLDGVTGEHRLASYIVHYAYAPGGPPLDLVRQDLTRWEIDAPSFEYRRNILVMVHGGLGDEICAEPVVRYLREKAYPKDSISVVSWYPRIFSHLNVRLFDMGNFKGDPDTPYYKMETMAPHGSPAWMYMSPNLMHTTDHSSLMCLRRVLADDEKQINLSVTDADVQEVREAIGDFAGAVLVHAGKGWPSKTFPISYWNEIIHGLVKAGLKVILIGKDINESQGTVRVDVPKGVVDSRNLLGLGAMFALMRDAAVLVSNDSSPVHIAGAFETQIVLIPTCKHPDHVLPVRKGTRKYKTTVLHKKLLCDQVDSTPTGGTTRTIDKVPGDIMDYLPDPKEVLDAVIAACAKNRS